MYRAAGLGGFFNSSADEIRQEAKAHGFSDPVEYIKWAEDRYNVKIRYEDDED